MATTLTISDRDDVHVGDLLAINGALYVVEGKNRATLLVRGSGKA